VSGRRGYTLVEISVVIVVIAVMASMLLPVMNYVSRARVAVTKDSLLSLAKALKRFHEDTGGWPSGNGVWNGGSAAASQQGPAEYATSDTSMHTVPSGLSVCAQTTGPLTTPCWGGPYINYGTSLGDVQTFDSWGHPYHYVYLPPGSYAPNGMIAVWSMGPDGVDATTDLSLVAKGQTAPDADDIIQIVGSAI